MKLNFLASERRCAEDLRELPRAVHWREGLRLQGFRLSQDHSQLHVPGDDVDDMVVNGMILSFDREVTLQLAMELAASRSMGTSLKTKTSA